MTTHLMRKNIEVFDFIETEETISISYWYGPWRIDRDPRHIVVDKKENVELMLFVDGPVSQWDCINMVVFEECRKINSGLVNKIDMAAFQKDLRNN